MTSPASRKGEPIHPWPRECGRQTRSGYPGRNRVYEVDSPRIQRTRKRKGKETYLIQYVFRGLRLAPARKTPLVDHLYKGRLRVTLCVRWCVVPRLRWVALYERGSVHVNTMGFHSRGILDVVAPVRERGLERDLLPPMTRGKSTNKVGCARQTPVSFLAVVCCLTAPRRSPLSFRAGQGCAGAGRQNNRYEHNSMRPGRLADTPKCTRFGRSCKGAG